MSSARQIFYFLFPAPDLRPNPDFFREEVGLPPLRLPPLPRSSPRDPPSALVTTSPQLRQPRTAACRSGRDIAQLAGSASRIDIDTMSRTMGERPNIQRLVRHFEEATMARVLQSVACDALHTVEARSCCFILTIHYRIDRDTLALTHEFLAERLGVQRTTVSAVMSKLHAKGLIRQGKGGITVTDPVGLEAVACECYGKVRDALEDLLPYPPSTC